MSGWLARRLKSFRRGSSTRPSQPAFDWLESKTLLSGAQAGAVEQALVKKSPTIGSGAGNGAGLGAQIGTSFDQNLAADLATVRNAQSIYGSQVPCMGQGISANDVLQIMGVPAAPKFKGNVKSFDQAMADYSKQLGRQANNAVALANFLNSPEAQADGLRTVAEVADFLANVRLETTAPGSGAGLTALTEARNQDELQEKYGRFPGRGDLMTTGLQNYGRASLALFGNESLLTHPELVANDPVIAARTAGFYWKDNHLSKLADHGNVDAITLKIVGNGARYDPKYDQTRLQRVENATNATNILGNCGSMMPPAPPTPVGPPTPTPTPPASQTYSGTFTGNFTDGPFFGSDGGPITVTVAAGQNVSTAVASAIDQLINNDLATDRQSLKPGESLASGTRSVTVSNLQTSATTVTGSYSASGGSGLTAYNYSGGFTIAPPTA